VRQFSNKWWFWSRKGQKTWRTCKAQGEESAFWKENKCGDRVAPVVRTKYWWWTTEGKKTWEGCKKQGSASEFWKAEECGKAK
jgi:hypothetical protein